MSEQEKPKIKTHVVRNVKTEDFHVKYQPRQQQQQQQQQSPQDGDSNTRD